MDLGGRINATIRIRGGFAPALALRGRVVASVAVQGRLNPLPINLYGRITAGSIAKAALYPLPINLNASRSDISVRFKVTLATVANLEGRVTATSRGRLAAYPPVYLSGLITAASSAWLRISVPVPGLAGRIRTIFQTRNSLSFVDTSRLVGSIKTMVTARVFSRRDVPVSGRITVAAQLRLPPRPYIYLTGRVTATVRAVLRDWPVVNLSGRVTTGVRAKQVGAPFRRLMGRITITSRARLSGVFIPRAYLAGRIKTTVRARIAGHYDLFVQGGRIKATLSARLNYPALPTSLYGGNMIGFRGPSLSARMFGSFQPVFELRSARITITLRITLATSEMEPPPPPYPTWFPTYTAQHYLDRVTSEHNQRPKFMTTVELSVEPYVEEAFLAAKLPGLFDLDYSVGAQEDCVGEWIGKSRWIELPIGFFSWDTPNLGWDQANWKGPFDAANYLERLDDYHYRMLLYAAIIANHWDGSVPKAYEAWDTLFTYTGLRVIIQDYGNMTMLYGLLWKEKPTTVLLSLFTTGQMDLRPEGIELIAYVFPPTSDAPLFAWDAESDSVAGWDVGSWGILVDPGVGFVPI